MVEVIAAFQLDGFMEEVVAFEVGVEVGDGGGHGRLFRRPKITTIAPKSLEAPLLHP
jgi:hypothetical protein